MMHELHLVPVFRVAYISKIPAFSVWFLFCFFIHSFKFGKSKGSLIVSWKHLEDTVLMSIFSLIRWHTKGDVVRHHSWLPFLP